VDIIEVKQPKDEVIEAMRRLVPQLTSNTVPLTVKELSSIIEAPCTHLFLARDRHDNNNILGMLTLAIFYVPSGKRAWIEDVVVEERQRGKGIGEALLKHAIHYANQTGAGNVGLTSNPSRAVANHLYLKLGFKLRETNVYQLRLV
jgi:GNAT superfamily N-acetyltransferase